MKISLIGSGSLALGLLCPWLSRVPGCRIHVLTRSGPRAEALRKAQEYDLAMGPATALEAFPHELLDYDPDDLESVPAQGCAACLEGSDVIIVSIGANKLHAVARLIARACRNDGPPLHLLAFENLPDASRQLRQMIVQELRNLGGGSRELVPHAAIPDRACTRRVEEGRVRIQAERFGEILLERSAADLFEEILDPVAPVPYVRFLEPTAVPLGEMRKFWLVNGTHTALGVLCAQTNRQLLRDGLADSRIAELVRTLHSEWVQILHGYARERGQAGTVFSDGELASHARRMFDRLKDLPDFSVRDVLRELTDVANPGQISAALQRLLQKLDDRLARQILVAGEMGGPPVPVSGWVLATATHVVRQHGDTYLKVS